MIRTAIITVSDSSFAGTREDRSGPAIADHAVQLGWSVVATALVPDDSQAIAAKLRELADKDADLIFTTGGTGVAARDVTPEATRMVIEREIPGIGEVMRAEGRKSTKFAALSRSVAGTRGATLIINLPGSPGGAVQSLNAIADLVSHVVDLLHGRTSHGDLGAC